MNIRKFIYMLLGIVVFPCHVEARHKSKCTEKPNIIYILADDLSASDLGYCGQELIETPHIDALARMGMVFTAHYTGQPTTVAARCVLLTGLHSGHACIRGTDHMEERGDVWNYRSMLADSTLEGQRPMPANTENIAFLLKQAGYTTGCVGSWGLGFPGSDSTPNKMGFDFFYGYNCLRQGRSYYPPFLYRNEQRVYLNNQFMDLDEMLACDDNPYDSLNYAKYVQQDYAPEKIYNEALDFVSRHQNGPFALFWFSPLPHAPLQAPDKWVSFYREKMGEESPFLGGDGKIPCRYPRATHAAMVTYLDEQIGGLVRKLKDLGLYENTLIVFTTDANVEPYGDKQRTKSNELSFSENSFCESVIRVPMIASWPNKIVSGTTSAMVSAFYDMLPTFCDIADLEMPICDGVSLLPTFNQKRRKQKEHDFLFWKNSGIKGESVVRMGYWKAFVEYRTGDVHTVKLFDLQNDPQEKKDVAAQHPKLVQQVLNVLKAESW